MSHVRRLGGILLLAALGLGAAPRPARAGEKIAVLVLGSSEKDAELADNLTEVLIAYVAQHGGFEIAGKEEFRARLGVENEKRSQACLDDIACLGRAGVSLGVRRIVAGSVGTRGKQYLFNLNLNNVEEGRIESRVFRLVEGGVEDLIHAVQEASGELFRPHVEPGKIQVASQTDGARVSIDNAYLGVTPLMSGTLLAGKHTVRVEADGHFPWASRVEVLPGQELQIKLSDANLPERRAWPASAAYGTAIVAAASLAAGGFLGELSQVQPSGATRQLAENDLEQRRHFALGANISFGSAVVFGAVSLYFFIRYHDDIFGRAVHYDDAP
jgi:hypothetical protein